MAPLLSIVIPSHNEAALVEQAVQSILSDPAFDGSRVELCLSDNSLSSETGSVIKPIMMSTPGCSYRRSLDAPTLDENVRAAASMASGEFLWFFGDDDLLCPGALGGLLEAISKRDVEIMIVNSTSFDQSGTVETRRVIWGHDVRYAEHEDDRFLSELGSYATYACAIVIAKRRWDNFYAVNAMGTLFAHLATLYRAKRGAAALFRAEPAIAMRLHRQTWLSRHFEVWNVFYPRVIWSLDGYSDSAKASVISPDPARSLARLAASRAYGRFNKRIHQDMIAPRPSYGRLRKVAALLVAITPREIMRGLYIVYIRTLRRHHKETFSPSLALAHLRRG